MFCRSSCGLIDTLICPRLRHSLRRLKLRHPKLLPGKGLAEHALAGRSSLYAAAILPAHRCFNADRRSSSFSSLTLMLSGFLRHPKRGLFPPAAVFIRLKPTRALKGPNADCNCRTHPRRVRLCAAASFPRWQRNENHPPLTFHKPVTGDFGVRRHAAPPTIVRMPSDE